MKITVLIWEVLEALTPTSKRREMRTKDSRATYNLQATQAHAGLQRTHQTCLRLFIVSAEGCGVREGIDKLWRHLNLFWVLFCFMFYLGRLRDFFPLSAARASIYNNTERQSSRLAPVGLHTVESVFNYEKLKTRGICLD